MRKRSQSYSDASHSSVSEEINGVYSRFDKGLPTISENVQSPKRSTFLILALFVLVMSGSWAVHHYQFNILPDPLTAEQAGKRGFSEEESMKHVKVLVELGPHPVGSSALDVALEYVLAAAENIKKTAHSEVDVDVDFYHVNSGANLMGSGLFKGRTVVYSDLKHIVLRISPKHAPDALENAILVSSHIDTVFSTGGAGDCSSCIAVMLELARGVSHWAHGFKNSVIFLFNTGEEEGLSGAHGFITQHPWNNTIHTAIDMEAMGIGGKSGIFQAGPDPWAIENYAMVAKYPCGQITAQDLFSSGIINSATDFQVYKEVGGLSGLDFAYVDHTDVYHTKNDKLELLKPGSFQHLGENMLAFLVQVASKVKPKEADEKTEYDPAIYFDILGKYMIIYHQLFANMLYNSVIILSLITWAASILMGGYTAAISLALSVLGILLMWICSLGLSVIVAFALPFVSSSWPLFFVSSPWLAAGLLGAPALLGALIGQHLGYLVLRMYLSHVFSRNKPNVSPVVRADWAKLDTERWLYKAGLLQWLVVLIIGNYFRIGSSYLALVWFVSPAFAYGLLEATSSSARLPKPLKTITLLMGLFTPYLISAGTVIRLAGTIIGNVIRLDTNPGSAPEWIGNVVLSVYIAAVICLTMVYLLSYVHVSGAKPSIVLVSVILFSLSLVAVLSGIAPPFTEDNSRAVNVVHVVDRTGKYSENQEPSSYVSLYSLTPGKLTEEAEHIGEGFVCGMEKVVDFVTFSAKYSCWTQDNVETGWNKLEIPTLDVASDLKEEGRVTKVLIDTKISTRWALGINTEEIDDFHFREDSGELIPLGDKSSKDGWHIIRFSGGKNAPKKFELTLFWVKNYTRSGSSKEEQQQQVLLKLRTDVDRVTPKAEEVLKRLPSWCSLFGKSTAPKNLAFLTSLPVHL